MLGLLSPFVTWLRVCVCVCGHCFVFVYVACVYSSVIFPEDILSLEQFHKMYIICIHSLI